MCVTIDRTRSVMAQYFNLIHLQNITVYIKTLSDFPTFPLSYDLSIHITLRTEIPSLKKYCACVCIRGVVRAYVCMGVCMLANKRACMPQSKIDYSYTWSTCSQCMARPTMKIPPWPSPTPVYILFRLTCQCSKQASPNPHGMGRMCRLACHHMQLGTQELPGKFHRSGSHNCHLIQGFQSGTVYVGSKVRSYLPPRERLHV